MQYENFQGIGTTTLVTGGPIRVALHFPKLATVVAKRPPKQCPRSPQYTTFTSLLNFVSTVLGLILSGRGLHLDSTLAAAQVYESATGALRL